MNILETSYGRFHIYVNYLPSQDENLIHLSFVDKNNKTHIVLMRQLNGKWFFANPETLSDWIIGLEEQFDILITGEILKNYQPLVTAI
ncbi:MAG: hypothetical protein J7502_06435 [Flavisolibacter sp.]|nr:hypothetical protein [Flavisolibacter sp.]